VSTSIVKRSEVEQVLGTGCLSLLEDKQIIWSLLLLSYSFGSVWYHCIHGCMFCGFDL